jgi:hypothetical protein
METPAPIGMPRWAKIFVIIAALLIAIVVITSIDWSSRDEPDQPNLIGFDTTTR